MKILYAIQSTGNGHIARAQEILPWLNKIAQVDVLTSGHQSQINLGTNIQYQLKGISLMYDSKGGLSYRKMLINNHFFSALYDIKNIPVQNYDLVLNDFEPITAWACKIKKIPCLQISHQAALLYPESPKPSKKNSLGFWVLKYYAISNQKLAFHFKSYHPNILTPVIRQKIKTLNPIKQGHYVVYLPSFSDDFLIQQLSTIPVQWQVFSKYCKQTTKSNNITVKPIDEDSFLYAFESCNGILCNAGFETPAEALFLGKKLLVIPIKNQYEQECNAAALSKMGVANSKTFDVDKIKHWVNKAQPIHIKYPNNLENLVLERVQSMIKKGA